MGAQLRACMWCHEELDEDEKKGVIQGHTECSLCAALDGDLYRAGFSVRDSARLSVLDHLKRGFTSLMFDALPRTRRARLRPSTYAVMGDSEKKEIDRLLKL